MEIETDSHGTRIRSSTRLLDYKWRDTTFSIYLIIFFLFRLFSSVLGAWLFEYGKALEWYFFKRGLYVFPLFAGVDMAKGRCWEKNLVDNTD